MSAYGFRSAKRLAKDDYSRIMATSKPLNAPPKRYPKRTPMKSVGVRMSGAYRTYLDRMVAGGYAYDLSDAIRICIYRTSLLTDVKGMREVFGDPTYEQKSLEALQLQRAAKAAQKK